MKKNFVLRALVEGAILVALAMVLSYLKIWRMPWGGSVTLAMVPIVFYAVRWGLGHGLLAAFVLGILQFLFDGGFVIGWQSILGDYIFAYGMLGLAGLCKRQKYGIFFGSLIGGAARFVVHYIVGATLWAEYMPDEFFGMTMTSPWIYSLLYNLAYMVPNIIAALVVAALLYKPLRRYILAQDLQ